MDKELIKSLSNLEGESLQDTVKYFVNTLLKTNSTYNDNISCRVEGNRVYVKPLEVEKSGTMPLKNFGVNLDQLDPNKAINQLVNWDNITLETSLTECVRELETTVVHMLTGYILAFTEDQEIEELFLRIQSRIEDYIDSSAIHYKERIRIAIVNGYEVYGYLTPSEMSEKKTEFLDNMKEMSENPSFFMEKGGNIAETVDSRLKFNIREYLASVRSRTLFNDAQLYLDVWALCLAHLLKNTLNGEDYNFSLELKENNKTIWSDIVLSVWPNTPGKREKTARLCKYPNRVKNISFFLSHPKDCQDLDDYYKTQMYDEHTMPVGLLNVKEWVFRAIELFEYMVDITQQYMLPGENYTGEIRMELLALFIKSLGAFQFRRHIKTKYHIVNNDLFLHNPRGFWRPHNKKINIVEFLIRDFLQNDAISIGMAILNGSSRAYTNSKLLIMKAVNEQSTKDYFPHFFKNIMQNLDYSIENTESLMCVFSLLAHLCDRSKDNMVGELLCIDDIIASCTTYVKFVLSYMKKHRADIQGDLYDKNNPFHVQNVMRGFIHAEGVFSEYPELVGIIWKAFQYIQLNLISDFVLDTGTYLFPLTTSEERSSMKIATHILNTNGPCKTKPKQVIKSGHFFAVLSQNFFNIMRKKSGYDYLVTPLPGTQNMTAS